MRDFVGDSPLSINQALKMKEIKSGIYREKGLVVYREDDLCSLQKLYNDQKLYKEKVYMIGCKSKIFMSGNRKMVSEQGFLVPDNASDKMFIEIFDRIHKRLKIGRSNLIKEFKRNNTKFYQFFMNHNIDQTKSNLLIGLRSLPNKERVLIKDYYWFFLHTIESEGETALVSSSLSHPDMSKNSKVYFEAFVPRPYYNYTVSSDFHNQLKEKVYNYNLPVIETNLIQNENEISFRRAILPHFILSVSVPIEGKRFVNPHIFSNAEVNTAQYISKNGIYIDQSDFDIEVSKTQYEIYGEYVDGAWSSFDSNRESSI